MKEPAYLGEVADVFVLKSTPGVIVAPVEAWAAAVRLHDGLRLVQPDGKTLKVKVAGIEMSNPPRVDGKFTLLLTGENLSQAEVPVGSKLWLEGEILLGWP